MTTIRLTGVPYRYSLVQPLPKDRIALCGWESEHGLGPTREFCDVLGRNGDPVSRLDSGKQVICFQSTNTGLLWVVYGGQGDSYYIARCFDANGTALNTFSNLIDDYGLWVDVVRECYALNVTSEGDSWVWFYPGFPLARVS